MARASYRDRAAAAVAELVDALRAYDVDGVPPPLLQLARRTDDEKPYNAYLGWLLDPTRGHGAGVPALRRLVATLGFHAMAQELSGADVDVEVRCERRWPEGAGSSREPDLVVIAPRGAPRALLLIENKVHSGESGDQYPHYDTALRALAAHLGIPEDGFRAYLLAPDDRLTPAGWTGVLSHSTLAGVLDGLADDPALGGWDRALCFLVADAFRHDAGASALVSEARALRDRFLRGDTPSMRDIRRIAELLPLPPPFRWSH